MEGDTPQVIIRAAAERSANEITKAYLDLKGDYDKVRDEIHEFKSQIAEIRSIKNQIAEIRQKRGDNHVGDYMNSESKFEKLAHTFNTVGESVSRFNENYISSRLANEIEALLTAEFCSETNNSRVPDRVAQTPQFMVQCSSQLVSNSNLTSVDGSSMGHLSEVSNKDLTTVKQSLQLVFLEGDNALDKPTHTDVPVSSPDLPEENDEESLWETCSEGSDYATVSSVGNDDLESCIADDYEYMSNHFLGIYEKLSESEDDLLRSDLGLLNSYEGTSRFFENGLLPDYGGYLENVKQTLDYLRHFYPQIRFCYARFGRTLYGLLCNDIKWNWIATCQESFIQMKRSISQGVVLYRVSAVGVYRPPSLILASS
uniref:Uncharacterized protein n=1 Tax=Lygus hesperus TaxID=30085 RepID=A0A146LBN3_LYGHE